MFAKSARADAAGAGNRAPSLIGPDLELQGNVSGSGDLHLDGRIVGDISVRSLTIGETGSVEGAVEADTIDVRGHVSGSLHAKTVRLAASARVQADVVHEQMSVELGAQFQGRLTQTGVAAATPQLTGPA